MTTVLTQVQRRCGARFRAEGTALCQPGVEAKRGTSETQPWVDVETTTPSPKGAAPKENDGYHPLVSTSNVSFVDLAATRRKDRQSVSPVRNNRVNVPAGKA
jgi:hypothetical protein